MRRVEVEPLFNQALTSEEGILITTNLPRMALDHFNGWLRTLMKERPELRSLSVRLSPDRRSIFIVKDYHHGNKAETAGGDSADFSAARPTRPGAPSKLFPEPASESGHTDDSAESSAGSGREDQQ